MGRKNGRNREDKEIVNLIKGLVFRDIFHRVLIVVGFIVGLKIISELLGHNKKELG